MALGGAMASALLAGQPRTAAGQPIEIAVKRPLAIRGGVMMVPIQGPSNGAQWPLSLDLILEDGRTLPGRIVWLMPGPLPAERGWTDDPRQLLVHAEPPEGQAGAANLLVRLPENGRGRIALGRQTIEPVWVDAPAAPGPPHNVPLELEFRPDRPDPESPFAYWRWALLAERLGSETPPTDSYGELGSLIAEHYADLWRLGLERLAAEDPPLAERCRQVLTSVGSDRAITFATWVAAPTRTSDLLAVLLDQNLRGQRLRESVQFWLDGIDPVLIWLESAGGERVELAVVNRTNETLIARLTWPGGDEIPIAVELLPRALTPVTVDRPLLEVGASQLLHAPAARSDVLQIEVAKRRYQLSLGTPYAPAAPPAAFVHRLHPSMTLAEVEAGQPRPVPDAMATFVHLRRRGGQWEVFFECRRPEGERVSPVAAPIRLPSAPDDEATTVGIEAVTLILGPEVDPSISASDDTIYVVVPESGSYEYRGGRPGTPEVSRRSFADRWYCRIVLPDSWLPEAPGSVVLLGCSRTHGGGAGFEVAPANATPWRAVTGRAAIDLSQWSDLPTFATPPFD